MVGNWYLFTILSLLGSALGGVCRYQLSGWVDRWTAWRFPAGTFTVNVSGAFAAGLVWGLPWESWAPVVFPARDFLLFGFLGGYTTVSSYALNTLQLWQEEQQVRAALNLFATHLLCLGAVFTGAALVM